MRALTLLVMLAASAAAAQGIPDDPYPDFFRCDKDVCFERRYDAAHLRRNPGQQTAEISIGALARFNSCKRCDFPHSDINAVVRVRLRGKSRTHVSLAICTDYWDEKGEEPKRKTRCALKCSKDGDDYLLSMDPGGKSHIPLDDNGFLARCAGAKSGPDDKTFRLDLAPVRACGIPANAPKTREEFSLAANRERKP